MDTPCDQASPEMASHASKKKIWLAGVLNIFIPGLGHLIVGRASAAARFLFAYLVYMSLFWPFRLMSWYTGFAIILCGGWALSVIAVWQVCNFDKKHSKWWLLLIL